MTTASRAWVGVVSELHVQRGVQGGFTQMCHGKHAPLVRMSEGDWLVYYSPKTAYPAGAALRAFTAIGRVKDARVYTVDTGDGFVPHRRDIAYRPTKQSAPVAALAPSLHFVRDHPNWGMLARRGHFEIDTHDLRLIAGALGARVDV